MARPAVTALQFFDILIISLVAGSIFGIWRGYNPAAYSAATFLEVHQGAVRGLNVILPAMGFSAIVATALLAVLARRSGISLSLYLMALVAMVAAGLITRFLNQPINAEVARWTLETMPANWGELRDAWWRWHLARLGFSIAGAALLIAAVFVDRGSLLQPDRPALPSRHPP